MYNYWIECMKSRKFNPAHTNRSTKVLINVRVFFIITSFYFNYYFYYSFV